MAGAIFSAVPVLVSLFVAGALFGKCHFSWQVHPLVKSGMAAGARNVVFFRAKSAW